MAWLSTFLPAAVKEAPKAKSGQAIGRQGPVHLDGYDLLPFLTTGEQEEG